MLMNVWTHDIDFNEQENDALLLDIGDNSGEGHTAYMSNSNFLWEDLDNYIRQQETVSAISWPQDSAKGQTNVIDIFEQLFGKDIGQKIMTVTNCYAEQFKNSGGNIFSK